MADHLDQQGIDVLPIGQRPCQTLPGGFPFPLLPLLLLS